jgi:hypothetical protein
MRAENVHEADLAMSFNTSSSQAIGHFDDTILAGCQVNNGERHEVWIRCWLPSGLGTYHTR